MCRMRLISFIIGVLFIHSKCTYSQKLSEEDARSNINNVTQRWKYCEQEAKTQVKVIYYSDKAFGSLLILPAFIIGVTATGDTIGAIDRNWMGTLKVGSKISLEPPSIPLDHEFPYNHTPAFRAERSPKTQKIFESVSLVYNSNFLKVK